MKLKIRLKKIKLFLRKIFFKEDFYIGYTFVCDNDKLPCISMTVEKIKKINKDKILLNEIIYTEQHSFELNKFKDIEETKWFLYSILHRIPENVFKLYASQYAKKHNEIYFILFTQKDFEVSMGQFLETSDYEKIIEFCNRG